MKSNLEIEREKLRELVRDSELEICRVMDKLVTSIDPIVHNIEYDLTLSSRTIRKVGSNTIKVVPDIKLRVDT